MRFWKVASLLLLAAMLASGCAPQRNESQSIFKWSKQRPEFDKEKLDRLYLETKWDLPICGEGEEITSVYFSRDTSPTGKHDLLFVESSLNWLYCVDAQEGFTLWQYKLPYGLSYRPTVYRYPRVPRDPATMQQTDPLEVKPVEFLPHKTDEVFLVSKDILFVLDVKGNELWRIKAPALPSTAAAGNARYVFFGGFDDRVYGIEKENQIVKWQWLTGGPLESPPLVIDQKGQAGRVIVTSADGNVYAFDPDTGKPKSNTILRDSDWIFDTHGAVLGGAAHTKTYTFFGSADYSGYALDNDWNLFWRLYCGAPISQTPVIIRTRNDRKDRPGVSYESHTVYFLTDDGRIFAREYNKKSKVADPYTLSWSQKGHKILSKGIRYLYIIDEEKTLFALDNDNGHVKWRGDFTQDADFFTTNDRGPYFEGAGGHREVDPLAGVIYLGFRQGWIVALREKSLIE